MADFDKPAGYPVKALSSAVKNSQKKKPDKKDDSDSTGSTDTKDKPLPKVDPKKFVIINPPMKVDGQTTGSQIIEGLSQSKIDYLIRLGLGDQDELTYYRKAMSDPKKAMMTPNLRPYVADLLAKLLHIVFSDTQIYTRVTTVLKSDLPMKAKERRLGESLIRKSAKSGFDIDILIEVFRRGLKESGGDQESAFNRVNSFIAGGKARKMDSDLAGIGSDELTKRYADATPGQTFSLIKKALKGTNND